MDSVNKNTEEKKHKQKSTWWKFALVIVLVLALCGGTAFGVSNLFHTRLSDSDMEVITKTVREDVRSYIESSDSNTVTSGMLLSNLSDEELEEFTAGVSSIVTTNLAEGISQSQLDQISNSIVQQLEGTVTAGEATLSDADIEMIANSVAIIIKQDLAELLTDYVTQSELNEILNSMESDVTALSEQINNLTSKFTELSNSVTNITEIVNQPDTETINQISQCSTEITNINSQITELNSTLETYQYNMEQMVKQLGDEFNVQLEVQQTQVIELQVLLSDLTNTVEELNQYTSERFDLLEQELNTSIDQTNQLLQESVIELQSYIDGNTTSINNLCVKLDETAESLTNYINLCDKNQTENLERNVTLINQTIDALDEQIHNELDENVTLINQTIDALTATVEQNEVNRDRAMAQMNTDLTNNINDVNTSLTEYIQDVESQLPHYTWGTDAQGQTMVTVTTPN